MSENRRRLTPAGVVASIALFLALGAGAYAAANPFVGGGAKIHGCVAGNGALTVVKAGKGCPAIRHRS